MEFSRLRASIANNSGETPSVYMAMCMVESLLDDIEDETGQEVGDWPIGDDTLPTKMVWLCQVIGQIYEEKNKELIRNRARLDKAVKELKEVSAELETLSETAVRLSTAKIDLKKRQTALERARAEQKEYEKITEQCRLLQLEADSLRDFDKAAEEAKLQALREETADLAEVKSALTTELAAVSSARDEVVEEIADLKSEIEMTTALVEQKNDALSDMERQRLEALRCKRELEEQLHEATDVLSGLQDAVSQLQREKVPEKKRQRDDEEARKDSLERMLASLELEIGQILEKNQELSAGIERAKEDLKAHNSAYSHLTEDYKQKNEEIAALAKRLEDLLGKNVAQKHEIYKRQMEEQIAGLEQKEQECAAMEETLAKMDQVIKAKQREAEELSKKKEQAESVERKISDVLRKLGPVASGDFIIRLEENRQRLETLEHVRENLSGTLADMKRILGEMPVNDNGAALDSMEGTLQGLLDYTDKLQKALVTYARNVTLGESK